jgi:hypothetical protein
MAKWQRAASVRPDQSFKGRQFTAEVILWAVRWYLMFPISYRDLALMLADRGVEVAHTTLFRWTQTYAPEIEKRIRPHLRPSKRFVAGRRDLDTVGEIRKVSNGGEACAPWSSSSGDIMPAPSASEWCGLTRFPAEIAAANNLPISPTVSGSCWVPG